MTPQHPRLKQLFYGETPMRVYSKTPKLLLKVLYKLTRMYWKKRNPAKYLQALCSIVVSVSNDIKFATNEYAIVVCPFSTVKEMTSHVDTNASLIQDDYQIVSLPSATKETPWIEWCQTLQIQEHIKLHAYYAWILTQACSVALLDVESASTANTLRQHNARLINWAYYFESIIEAKL